MITSRLIYDTGRERILIGYIDPEEFHRMTTKREYSRDEPVALDDRDPSNTDPETLTEALEPHDNVYGLIFQDQGDLREASPVGHDPADPA